MNGMAARPLHHFPEIARTIDCTITAAVYNTSGPRLRFPNQWTHSGKPIKYLKGIETEQGFEEVPEEEIIKGYEHAKGHHVLIKPEEIDDLKLEAKHTIDMVRFVDLDQIDTRYFEKPYYLLPDGDQADEGYTVLRDALAKTGKAAVGQLIMHGREHLVSITAHGKGLVLVILRYPHELRDAEPYFEKVDGEVDNQAVKLAVDLIDQSSGRFEPEKMIGLLISVHPFLRSSAKASQCKCHWNS
jgi:DNA end-binding protein Ku